MHTQATQFADLACLLVVRNGFIRQVSRVKRVLAPRIYLATRIAASNKKTLLRKVLTQSRRPGSLICFVLLISLRAQWYMACTTDRTCCCQHGFFASRRCSHNLRVACFSRNIFKMVQIEVGRDDPGYVRSYLSETTAICSSLSMPTGWVDVIW